MEKTEKNDRTIDVKILSSQPEWNTSFDKTAKVQEVIDAVIKHFNFALNGKYELRLQRDPDNDLKPERTLVSYHMVDGEVLIFTDKGKAV